jgi:hypothetical protein
MKKIILHDGIKVFDIHKDAEDVKVRKDGTGIQWDKGSVEGLREDIKILVIDNDVEVNIGDDVTENLLQLNQRLDLEFEKADTKIQEIENRTTGMQGIDDFTLEKIFQLEERIAVLETKVNGGV